MKKRSFEKVRANGVGKGCEQSTAFTTRLALVPPKPKLLLSAALTRRAFAVCGTRSTPSVPSSGSSRLSVGGTIWRSEEHTSELQSLMRLSYDVVFLKKKKKHKNATQYTTYEMKRTKTKLR